MTKTQKLLSLILAAIMLLSCLSACGEPKEPVDTDPTDYTEKTFQTYSENGDYFFNTTEILNFTDLPTKDIKGLRLTSLNSKFTFAAQCEGKVKLYIWTDSVSAPYRDVAVKITVDGANEKTERWLSSGGNALIAEVQKGNHTFTIEKLSGGANLYIGAVTLCGELTEAPRVNVENGVFVEVFKPAGGDDEFCSFNVYTQTTHPSGEYYIRYNFVYEYDDIDETLTWGTGSNTGSNRMNYRIKTAQIVKKTGNPGFLNIHNILQSGEISLAIKERNLETGKNAGDFVGGFHGDENLKNASLVLDGNKEIDLYQGEAGFYNCSTVEFKQFSTICRCHTPLEAVMDHNQHYLIDTNGIRLDQQVVWLSGDFAPTLDQTYLQMFTLVRTNPDKTGDFLTDTVTLLDENGGFLAKSKVSEIDPGEKEGIIALQRSDARYAEYTGEEKGIYAKVGFQFPDSNCTIHTARISVRKYGDSKWYPSFKGKTDTPTVGEEWNVCSFYYIDYNPAE